MTMIAVGVIQGIVSCCGHFERSEKSQAQEIPHFVRDDEVARTVEKGTLPVNERLFACQ